MIIDILCSMLVYVPRVKAFKISIEKGLPYVITL
jgi:hypothetical protein